MTHKQLIDYLLTKKITVLFGAGVSYDSGLPIVDTFYQHFLSLFYDAEDALYIKKLIDNTPIPFERMMEHIISYTGKDYAIMNIFAQGEPNILHDILAKMMNEGWTNELYTTNFDCLIEKVLEDLGKFTDKDYGYYYDEKGFNSLVKVNSNSRNIIKIHGTIDKKESIRTTLETITSSDRLTSRKPIIERLFSTGEHDLVLVLGYSFSDKFDINYFIEKIDVTKEIVIIDHRQNVDKDDNVKSDLGSKNGNNPFVHKKCAGYIVEMNTLVFMKQLFNAKYGGFSDRNPKIYDWKNYLNEWVSKYDKTNRDYISGGIFNSLSEFQLGEKYIERVLSQIKPNGTELYISAITHYILSRSRTRNSQKECHELLELCEKTLNLLEDNKSNFHENYYNDRYVDLKYRIGRVYESGFFNYKKAIEQYFSVYRIEYRNMNILGMSQTIHQIGICYSHDDNLRMSLKCLKKSIKLKRKCGYIGGITRSYISIVSTYIENCSGDKRKMGTAMKYLEKVENTLHTGEVDIKNYYLEAKSIIHINNQEWGLAMKTMEEHFDILKHTPDIGLFATVNYNYGRCAIAIDNLAFAVKHLEQALNIAKDLNNETRIFRCNQELGLAYLLYGKLQKSFEHLSNNSNKIKNASNAEKGHYFLYVGMYYKKHDNIKNYENCMSVSKFFFKENGTVKEYYRMKRMLDKKCLNENIELNKDKYIVTDFLEAIKLHSQVALSN